ncbi:hypothetical protein AXG93_3217s1390 [Marchantia polymorpha subsp. ruderalis]|uniref:Uncharacterized protein n=1 Tax=Marchantia polymorpha subsp. ruderalis TaxID=1480154 RepID=A0A176VXL1_MARPO|nr:hypothetical protein AXG93_3217s1390 [Marchantia polymorpha subsp. ruderalis]
MWLSGQMASTSLTSEGKAFTIVKLEWSTSNVSMSFGLPYHPTRKAVAKSTSITSTFLGRRRYSVCGGLDETAAASGPHGVVNDHEIHTAATLSEDGRNDKTYYLHLVQVPGHLVTASDAGRPERQSLRKQSTKYMIPKTI